MTDNFFHGARVKENTDLQTTINDIDSTAVSYTHLRRNASSFTSFQAARCKEK